MLAWSVTISLDIRTLTNSLNIHTLTIMIQCTCMHACTLKQCVCFKNCDDHMMHVWSCGMPNICVFQELWWSHDAPRMCTSGVVECQTSVRFKNFDDHMMLQGYACLELWNAKQLCVSRTVMITWCSEDMYAHLELWIAKGGGCFKNCDDHMTCSRDV